MGKKEIFVLLSNNQARPGRIFTQPHTLHICHLCTSRWVTMQQHSLICSQEDFEELLEKEAEKERVQARGDSIGADPSCYETTDKGRKVSICLCSTDMCNAAPNDNGAGAKMAFAAIITLLASTADAVRLRP